jgi:ADP-dependent NAD(P)H-hydrate dehydratase / NAD(P)H-hydrate epimerase
MTRDVRGVGAVYGRDGVMLPTAAQSVAFDKAARESVPERVLMENAGRAAAQVLQRLYPVGRILGFAGSGHNGSDLLVMLRTLHTWGREVAILTAGAREPDMSLLHGHDIQIHRFTDYPRDITADILVDGMLGTGSTGAPRADAVAAIRVMNGMCRPIVALDLPSGVDPTTGAVPTTAVNAAATITFGAPKLGLLLYPARTHCGRLIAVEVGFPPFEDGEFAAEAITPDWARARVPSRTPDAHKGASGRLLILAGHSGMAGAAVIAAGAAVRSGAGVVRVASESANRVIVQTAVPEATFFEQDKLTPEDISSVTAVVAGPGLGRTAASRHALDMILQHGRGLPTLLDADALNMLADERDTLMAAARNRPLVITPHPKELSRLLQCSVDEVTKDRVAAAQNTAELLGCTVLLKGQPVLVADSGQLMLVNTVSSSDVAVAGMGDQLAGVIGGFMAAGSPPRIAAALALLYAGRAACIANKGRSLSPADVSDSMAQSFADPGPTRSALRLPFITFDQPAPT